MEFGGFWSSKNVTFTGTKSVNPLCLQSRAGLLLVIYVPFWSFFHMVWDRALLLPSMEQAVSKSIKQKS